MAINSFATDTDSEVALIRQAALGFGAMDAINAALGNGGRRHEETGRAVVKTAEMKSDFKFYIPLEIPIKERSRPLQRNLSADGVDYSPEAEPRSNSNQTWLR